MSNILKTPMNDYTKEMDLNFFCILRRFINNETMNRLINKVTYFNENYPYDEGKNPYVSGTKRRTNSLYSCFGFENKRMENWTEEKREKMLDKYYNVKKEMEVDLNKILSSIFYLLKAKQWKMLGITLFEIYPGCNEQEIHIDMPGIISQENIKRYYISIPLHKTELKMGPIIFYKETGMKEFRKHNYNEIVVPGDNSLGGGIIGHLNSLKWELKQVFLSARKQYEYGLGDISIHRDITYHNGGTNSTNKVRKFLFVACEVRY